MPEKKRAPETSKIPPDQCAPPVALSDADARGDRLAQLKRAIEDGTYRISAAAVADRVIAKLKKPSES